MIGLSAGLQGPAVPAPALLHAAARLPSSTRDAVIAGRRVRRRCIQAPFDRPAMPGARGARPPVVRSTERVVAGAADLRSSGRSAFAHHAYPLAPGCVKHGCPGRHRSAIRTSDVYALTAHGAAVTFGYAADQTTGGRGGC